MTKLEQFNIFFDKLIYSEQTQYTYRQLFMKKNMKKLKIMKKLLFSTLFLIFSLSLFSQGLNSNASYIKNNYPTEYRETIRTFAINEWQDDYEMIVYTINKQADALFEMTSLFRSSNTNILYKSMIEWTWGIESETERKFRNELTEVSVKQLIEFKCDWEMVVYTYKKQSSAKGSF